MPDYILKLGLDKDNIPSYSEVFLQTIEGDDLYLHVGTEVSPVSAESRVVVYNDPQSAGADRFRLARIRLKSIQAAKKKLKCLLITSPMAEDGKSTVALNLAVVLSDHGRSPVLLLEADVHRPVLITRLGLRPWRGLSECYKQRCDPRLEIRRIEPLGFHLLPAGQPVGNGSSFLQSNFTSELIKSLSSSSFSWILIDAPPTIPVADILALKAQSDATLLVVRAGLTPREAIEESIGNLGREHILGIILNGVEGLDRVYSKYYAYARSEAPGKPTEQKTIGGRR